MSNVLRGNFTPKRKVVLREDKKESMEDRFEREAAKKIGGSVAFVSKRRVMWSGNDTEETLE